MGSAAVAEPCRTIPLEPTPLWVSSATWSVDGSALLVVDVVRKSVVRYPITGEPGKVLFRAEEPQGPAPSILRTVDDGYLLERDDGILERRSESFELIESRRLPEVLEGPGGTLGSVNQWVPVGDRLLIFGDVRRPDGSWRSGVATAAPGASNELRVLRAFGADDPGLDLHLVPNHYLTELDGRGWFLLMEREPSLWEVRFPEAGGVPELRRVPLPAESWTRPDLMKFSGFDATREFYASLARAALPVGVFGGDGVLYLLRRSPAAQESTRWTLEVLDPVDGTVLRTLTLPTRAPHVQLVPGDSHWALIEKGPVEGLGVQKVSGARLLPAAWLTESASPLRGAASTAMCRGD